MFPQRITTLNIETDSIRLLALKGKRVERWESKPLAPGLVRDGLIVQPDAVAQAIGSLLKSVGADMGKVIVSMNSPRSVLRLLTLPRAKDTLLDEAIRRSAKKEMPLSPEELYLFWSPVGDSNLEQEFIVLGVPRRPVDAEIQTLVGSGVKPYIMDIKPLALARAVGRQDSLIVDMESDSFSIILVVNGIPAMVRTLTLRQEGGMLEDNISRLLDELSKTVEFYNEGHRENPIVPATPVFLTGQLAGDASTLALVRSEIQYPVESLVFPLECPSNLPVASYAVNFGLALRKVPQRRGGKGVSTRLRPLDFNILPDKYRARRWPSGHILFYLAVVLAIAGLFPMYQAKSYGGAETVRLRSQLDRVTRELRLARLAMNKEQASKEALDKVVAAVESLEQGHSAILSKGRGFAQILQLVLDTLPAGVHLLSIDLAADQITLKGEANNPSLVISYGKALEQKAAFTEVSITEIAEKAFGIVLKK